MALKVLEGKIFHAAAARLFVSAFGKLVRPNFVSSRRLPEAIYILGQAEKQIFKAIPTSVPESGRREIDSGD
jgi:hypothetical protein